MKCLGTKCISIYSRTCRVPCRYVYILCPVGAGGRRIHGWRSHVHYWASNVLVDLGLSVGIGDGQKCCRVQETVSRNQQALSKSREPVFSLKDTVHLLQALKKCSFIKCLHWSVQGLATAIIVLGKLLHCLPSPRFVWGYHQLPSVLGLEKTNDTPSAKGRVTCSLSIHWSTKSFHSVINVVFPFIDPV